MAAQDGGLIMATAFTTPHILEPAGQTQNKEQAQRSGAAHAGKLRIFFGDLLEDLRQRPLQAAHLEKHDMFREHINAMAICYFGIIVLLIAASLPVLAYLIAYQAL